MILLCGKQKWNPLQLEGLLKIASTSYKANTNQSENQTLLPHHVWSDVAANSTLASLPEW